MKRKKHIGSMKSEVIFKVIQAGKAHTNRYTYYLFQHPGSGVVMIIRIPHRNKKGLKGIEICGRQCTPDVYIPCYSQQNGYYTQDITIVYEGKTPCPLRLKFATTC